MVRWMGLRLGARSTVSMNLCMTQRAQRNNVKPKFFFVAFMVMIMLCLLTAAGACQGFDFWQSSFSYLLLNGFSGFYPVDLYFAALSLLILCIFGSLIPFTRFFCVWTTSVFSLFRFPFFAVIVAFFILASFFWMTSYPIFGLILPVVLIVPLAPNRIAGFTLRTQTVFLGLAFAEIFKRLRLAVQWTIRIGTYFHEGFSVQLRTNEVWAACSELGIQLAHDFQPSPHKRLYRKIERKVRLNDESQRHS